MTSDVYCKHKYKHYHSKMAAPVEGRKASSDKKKSAIAPRMCKPGYHQWSLKEEEEVITWYEERPQFYSPRHPDYKNTPKKKRQLQEFADKIGIHGMALY